MKTEKERFSVYTLDQLDVLADDLGAMSDISYSMAAPLDGEPEGRVFFYFERRLKEIKKELQEISALLYQEIKSGAFKE